MMPTVPVLTSRGLLLRALGADTDRSKTHLIRSFVFLQPSRNPGSLKFTIFLIRHRAIDSSMRKPPPVLGAQVTPERRPPSALAATTEVPLASHTPQRVFQRTKTLPHLLRNDGFGDLGPTTLPTAPRGANTTEVATVGRQRRRQAKQPCVRRRRRTERPWIPQCVRARCRGVQAR